MCIYAQKYHAGCRCTTWQVTSHCRESLATNGPCAFNTATGLENTMLRTSRCCEFHREDENERKLERIGKDKQWAGRQCKEKRLRVEKELRREALRVQGQLEAAGEKRKFDRIKAVNPRAEDRETRQNKRVSGQDHYGRSMVNTQASYADPIYRLYRQLAGWQPPLNDDYVPADLNWQYEQPM